ncbi:MAG: hypothetical protein ACYCR5_06570 [Leptospirillum sp.]
MDRKEAENSAKGKPSRVWTTNGKPDRPLPKVWNGAGRVIRNDKGGKK